MDNQALISKYELVIILDAGLGDDDKDAVVKDVVDVVKKAGGKVINSQVWLEKQRMTFPIKKKKEGTYYIINLEIDKAQANAIRPMLKLNDKVLRFELIDCE